MLDLGKAVKAAVQKQGMLAWQYNTVGVSDAITMGGEGLSLWVVVSDPPLIRRRDALLLTKPRDHRRQHRDGDLRATSRRLHHHPRV